MRYGLVNIVFLSGVHSEPGKRGQLFDHDTAGVA